ncbi:ZYRO0F08228p [Zygosaccharomyces rouxii]|uniref:ZYRO0F08228p n=1 Tax=Zygosaccharomyces rouxii (strain ATCC 2623 / CBS 732 / NBRC 1130 / NCYC 568 / NRRL Y-229) TaxID=559307 RepID=C5DXW1_ZYGRC|nr:uncharacterized protein ZYRO0F08228g [Zygosaccharomyces rouxii]KAH9199380.1 major facilitator superfamily domain-containing protein [Zygosaccharomyces rouxii]CAR28622.1 ZYRO0F08228p [Zygosaccharomyces rouxii]
MHSECSNADLSAPDSQNSLKSDEHPLPQRFNKGDASSVSTTLEPSEDLKGLSKLKDRQLWVTRNERRGVVANLSLIPEFKDSRDYPESVKKSIVFVIAFSSMMGPMATSIIFPSIHEIEKDFSTTSMVVNVSVGVYQISLGVFPLWWSSISEMNGRRTVYVVSFMLLLGFNIGCALSPNIGAFIALRFLSGAASASVQSVGAGTVSDLYVSEQRGRNLGIYYLGPLLAPLISPIIGAALVSHWSWRSTQWFLVILAGANVLILILFLPETLRKQDNSAAISAVLQERRGLLPSQQHEKVLELIDVDRHSGREIESSPEGLFYPVDPSTSLHRIISENSSSRNYGLLEPNIDMDAPQVSRIQSHHPNLQKMMREDDLRRVQHDVREGISKLASKFTEATSSDISPSPESKWDTFKRLAYIYLFRPIKSVYFLKYPPVMLAIIFSSVSFSILYFVNMTLEYDYSRSPYNFPPMLVGLMYIPNSVTYILAAILGGKWVDYLLIQYKAKHGILAPEARISWNIVTAVISFPISLVIFGWCIDKGEHWETPLVGTALFGYASMMTIGATVSYLVDSLPGRGATGVALNNLIRQLLAAVAVFVTEPLIKGMGTGWLFTMLAFIIIAAASVLVIIKKHGDYWRENYDLQKLYNYLE